MATHQASWAPRVEAWWRDGLNDQRKELAYDLFPLLLNPALWVLRQVERIEFLDEARVRRQTSVDFALPTAEVATKAPPHILPLALLGKVTLARFDLRDDSGTALPMMTKDENALISRTLLVGYCEAFMRSALWRNLDEHVVQDLDTIAYGDRDAARAAKDNFEFCSGEGSLAERVLIWDQPELRALISGLTDNFILCVALNERPSGRRVMKFSYEEEARMRRASPSSRVGGAMEPITQSIAWSPVTFRFGTPGMYRAQSYHVDIGAPEGVLVSKARLIEVDEPPRRRPSALAQEPQTPIETEIATAPPGFNVHLHVEKREPGKRGIVEVSFSPLPDEFVVEAFGICLLIFLVISAGLTLRLLLHIHEQPVVGGPVLVVLPGLLATYLARSGEHRLWQRLVWGLRVTVAVSAGASFAAAAVLAINVSQPWRPIAWGVLDFVAAAALLITAVAWSRARGIRFTGETA